MSKREQNISDALGNIDADYIEQALDYQPSKATVKRKRRVVWSAVACACLALIVAVSVGWLWRGDEPGVEPPDDDPPVVEPPGVDKPGVDTDTPMENRMDFHSWEELKLLCDATQGDSDKFLETLKILDEQYCTQKKTHVSFQLVHDKARYKDTFSNIYERIKDKKIIEFSNDVYIPWIEIKKGSDKVYVTVYGNINFKDEIIHLSYFAERNYTDHIENLQGESKITLKGEGYSVDVWSFSGLVDNKQVHKVYITEDGDDYPRFYVLVNSSKIDQPPSEELIRLLSELHITTIEEILEGIDS